MELELFLKLKEAGFPVKKYVSDGSIVDGRVSFCIGGEVYLCPIIEELSKAFIDLNENKKV